MMRFFCTQEKQLMAKKPSFFTKTKAKALRKYYSEDWSDKEILKYFEENTLDSMLIKDGTAFKDGFFPTRVIHDGFKVGTTSWIFYGQEKLTNCTCTISW